MTLIGADAAYHEWDVTLSKIPGSVSPPADPGALPVQLARAEVSTTARYVDYRCDIASPASTPFVISEIIDWQRPAGGRVFAAGAIAVGSKIDVDPTLGALARNVLHHFGVKQRTDLFVLSSTGRVRMRRWDGAAWNPAGGPGPTSWTDLGGSFAGEPAAVSWRGNHVSLLAVDSAGTIGYKWTDGVDWYPSLTTWQDITGGMAGTRSYPTLLNFIGS